MFNLFPKFEKLGWLTDTGYTIDGKSYSPAELMHEFIKLRDQLIQWKELYAEKADYVDELVKEVNSLRHLKEENVRLMERVNEIDGDQNEEYRAEIFTLKNDIAVLKAKYQILEHNYQGCTKYRDEYKHQLNAANKEIEVLKSKIRDYQDKYAKSFSNNDMDKLQKIIEAQKGEIKKLKEDIVDYVIKKDDELNKLKSEKVYTCNKCGYKVGHNTNYYGGCGFCKEGQLFESEEDQPTYPIHWGGWNETEKTTSLTDEWQCPCSKCKDKREGRSETALEERINKLEKKVEELTIVNICQKPH